MIERSIHLFTLLNVYAECYGALNRQHNVPIAYGVHSIDLHNIRVCRTYARVHIVKYVRVLQEAPVRHHRCGRLVLLDGMDFIVRRMQA